ncbi:MAG: DUF4265 domain-containing protein [Actinoallomurus sp.]
MQQDVTSGTTADCAHHVGLTSEEPGSGELVRELVPARRLGDGLVEITGSPALVMGCAAGDVLRVEEGGRFEVLRRGPNVSVQAFCDPAFSVDEVQRLTDGLRSLGGIVEAPPHRRFLVATVPSAAGRSSIDARVHHWAVSIQSVYWQYSASDHQPDSQTTEEGPGAEASDAFPQLDLFS